MQEFIFLLDQTEINFDDISDSQNEAFIIANGSGVLKVNP